MRRESLSFYNDFYKGKKNCPHFVSVHRNASACTKHTQFKHRIKNDCQPKRHWTFKPRVYLFVIHTTSIQIWYSSIKLSRYKAQIHKNFCLHLHTHSTHTFTHTYTHRQHGFIDHGRQISHQSNKIKSYIYIYIKDQLELKTDIIYFLDWTIHRQN